LLRGLTQRDVARFIEITAGVSPPASLVEAVYKETEGNPFFVNEIVRLLVTDGRLEQPETVTSWSVTIPQGVRDVVGRRLDHLSEDCNRVLTIGSVIGREFPLSVLEKVSEVKGDRLLEALEEAIGARVIAEVPRSADQYSFAHALIRETLYEELSTARRVRLHRQIGEVLEEMDPEAHLPQLAYHFAEAAQGGDVEKAIDYARRAAERAVALLAYEEAVGHYERALQTLELNSKPDEAERCELLLALGDALNMMGEVPKARESFAQAASIARKLRDSKRLGRAALGYADYFEPGTSQEPSVRILEEALAAVGEGDSPLRVRLLATLARELYFSEWHERARSLSHQAIEMARRVGDPVALALALFSTLFFVEAGEDVKPQFEERLAAGTEIIRLAEQAEDKALTLNGHGARVQALLNLGDVPALDQEIEVYGWLAEELRQPFFLWQEAGYRAMRALFEGRLEEAERLAQQALAVGRRSQGPAAMQSFGAQLYALRREQGRLAEVEAAATGFIQQYPAVPAWRAAVALIHKELDREEEARREFEQLAENDFAIFPRDGVWPISMAILAELAVYLNDTERAAALYEHLRPRAELTIVVGGLVDCYGSASRYLGLLAGALGRWEDAERHFEYALEANQGMGTRRWAAWTQCQYAEMLLDRGEPGGQEKALGLVTQALDTAQELGMKALVERCLRLKLRAQGIDAASSGASIDAVAASVYVDKPDLRTHAAPDGTVTIMFSDVEGSTALNERLGDKRWMELLREHNAIVREKLKTHGGFEVKSEGDGFMLAFQSAKRALECAIVIQQALAERNEGSEEPIRVRIGLHTGEAIKEGDDFFGKHVNLAARIASQACGGEILVSSLLKELADGGGDIAFGEGREVELKGLTGIHRVFVVAWGKKP
jgi:class 3 adenylate cyclase